MEQEGGGVAMPWSRVGDELPEHPKFTAAGPLAGWVWLDGLCYSNRNLTDGLIPEAIAKQYGTAVIAAAVETFRMAGWKPKKGRSTRDIDLPAVLVNCGLWERAEGGYRIHDFCDYNKSKKEVLAERAAWKERQKKSRSESRRDSHSDSHSDSHESHAAPVPVPVPVPVYESRSDEIPGSSSDSVARDPHNRVAPAAEPPRKSGGRGSGEEGRIADSRRLLLHRSTSGGATSREREGDDDDGTPLRSPSEGASKPLRSHAQEHAQEGERDQEGEPEGKGLSPSHDGSSVALPPTLPLRTDQPEHTGERSQETLAEKKARAKARLARGEKASRKAEKAPEPDLPDDDLPPGLEDFLVDSAED